MKLIRDTTASYLKISKKLYIYGYQEWSQLFQSCHWYNLTLVHVEGEIDNLANSLDFTVTLLGLGFQIRYYRPGESVAQKLAAEAYEAIKDGEFTDGGFDGQEERP